ncbi:MAG TPA: zinc-ribbon domain-containing protein [Mobilitalea sp.]|nr:zinc-ribbon domain-containing protein [Mobilitalea sp.]
MFCTKCGAKNDDGVKFCYQCGNRLNETVMNDHTQSQGPAYSQPQEPAYSQPKGPAYSQPQGPAYSQPQGPSYSQPQSMYNQSVGQEINLPKKSKKPLFIGLGSIACILLIIAIISSFSGKGKVLDNITDAAKGMLKAKSFEFTIGITDGRYDKEEVSGIVEYDFDKEKLNFDIETNEGMRQILYDGTMYEVEGSYINDREDLTYELEQLFNSFDEYNDALDGISKVDWEDIIDETGLSMFVDTDEFGKCVKKFEKNLNSKSYFKKVCNEFSAKKTGKGITYFFDVNVPKLVESVADTFNPAIEYNLDRIMDGILDEVDIFDKLVIEITIKDDKLVGAEVNITTEDYNGEPLRNRFTLEISDYGKASINEREIKNIINTIWD